MLQLKNITKVYGTGSGAVTALRGVSVNFRKSEFVSILGQSGCGKTTLLNVIGGLDHYTSGDLVINNRSTREFRDADWDSYRNHSVGFIFQTYNLIPHQTVLANVELALTLSGVPKAERRARAAACLHRVGLGDQLHKKPNQMSGGQMQRVAIARALINDPDILLADEPTGALDSATSVQIMEILKDIAKDKLVIMVTHNPELAEQYSTRIVRLLDGRLVSDSNPYTPTQEEKAAVPLTRQEQKKRKDPKTRRTSMSFFTALGLSFNNLMTKKARTFLTSFAGSIGIIGIALILAVSTGVNAYISGVQEETLSSYPIKLEAETTDMSGLLSAMMGANAESNAHDLDAVYSNVVMYKLLDSFMNAETKKNNLSDFLAYMEAHPDQFDNYTTAVQYLYDLSFDVYTVDKGQNTVKVDASDVFSSVLGDVSSSSMMSSYSSLMSSSSGMEIWEELIPGKPDENGVRPAVSDMLKDQYQLLHGTWPDAYDEVVLIVNSRNELSDMVLYALGLKDRTELSGMMADIMSGKPMENVSIDKWDYSHFTEKLGLSLVLPTDYYYEVPNAVDGKSVFLKSDDTERIAASGVKLRITGIISPAEGVSATAMTGSLGYTYHLSDYVREQVAASDVVTYQMLPENDNYDVLTGLPFIIDDTNKKTDAEKHQAFLDYVNGLSDAEKYKLLLAIQGRISDDDLKTAVDNQMKDLLAEGSVITDEKPVYDREKMEKFILDSYAQMAGGASTDLIQKYVDALDDERLAALIRSSIEEATKEIYRKTVEAQIEKTLDTVSAAELTAYRMTVLAELQKTATESGLSFRAVKQGYLLQNYNLLTALPQEAYAGYLTACDDSKIDSLLDGLLTIQGQSELARRVKEDAAYRAQKAASTLSFILSGMEQREDKDAAFAALYDAHMPSDASSSTLDDNLSLLGYVNEAMPDEVVIYMASFEDKEKINAGIDAYNATVTDKEDEIHYTDYVELLMSSVTTIINAISYVLIAFVAISLVVSSIMIGIITYISVLERTKEIGILRAIGASKGDVSRVFNAETITIGFTSGVIGIGVTLIFILIINIILRALTGIPNLNAVLPVGAAFILVGISMLLTFIAGLFPAGLAAKRDPVVALRSE